MGRPPIGERAMSAAEKQRRYRARKFGNKGAVTKTLPPAVAELEARVRELEAECNDTRARYWDMRAYVELRTEGIFTRAEFNKVRAVLHPDRAQSETERKRHAEAFDIFSRCEKLLKKDPLPPPPKLPTTRDEWMEARLRVMKKNRARGLKAAQTRARKKPGRQLRSGPPS